jgi:hypothetical protein
MANFKSWADETNVELHGKVKVDQENELIENHEDLDESPSTYTIDDDEEDMNRKDSDSKARRMEKVGIIYFCYQQIEKEMEISDKEFIKEYVRNTEGVDTEPLDMDWTRMMAIRQKIQTAINLELGRRNKIRRRKEY